MDMEKGCQQKVGESMVMPKWGRVVSPNPKFPSNEKNWGIQIKVKAVSELRFFMKAPPRDACVPKFG